MKRFKAGLDLKVEPEYSERAEWTLRLVELALKAMDDEYEALKVPEEQRTFPTGEIERMTRRLDPSEPRKLGGKKAGVHRSTYSKNLDIAAAIAKARREPPPSLPDFMAYANEWVQPDPTPETLAKRRSHLFNNYTQNELAERKVALGELLHHIEERRRKLDQFKFEDRGAKPYPNPPFRPRDQAMELYLHLRTVGRKRELAVEITDLEEKIAVERAHNQAHDLRYNQQMREVFLTRKEPSKKGKVKGKRAADVADASTSAG